MKVILTVIVALLLGSVTRSCSPYDKQRLFPSTSATPPPKAPGEDGIPTIPYDEMLRRVAGLSKQVGIVNLKEANLPEGQTEIRVWKAFGLITPRCIIIKVANGNAAAFLVTAKIAGGKGVFHNGNPVYVNSPLNAPRSGWDNFLIYLQEHGIGSSVNLALDKLEMPDPDSEDLILETKTGSRHTMAYYNDSTASVDGKKAFDVCKQIQTQFDVNLGCL